MLGDPDTTESVLSKIRLIPSDTISDTIWCWRQLDRNSREGARKKKLGKPPVGYVHKIST